jgi:hypothetical protein
MTVRYYGDSNYLPSIATLNLSNPISDFTLTPVAANIPVSSSSSTTDNIQLASVNSFAGTVNYTCSAATGITCSLNPTSSTLSSGGSTFTVLTVNAPSTAGNGTYNLLITGKDSTGQYIHTLSLEAIVSGAAFSNQTFSFSNSGNISVAPGANTGNTATITLTPSGGFTGVITLSCAITPVAANNPATCSITSPITITGTMTPTATLTVYTTAASALNQPMKLFWPSAGGAVLALVFLFGIPARRRKWLAMLGLLVLIVTAAGIGCGGGGGGGGGGGSNQGTTAGTYTITVTGTSGTITATNTISLTVQ